MSYNYGYAEDDLQKRLDGTLERLKKNAGDVEFVPFACKIIAGNLQNKPIRYIEYGVYWWAVKALLAEHGFHFGKQTDIELVEAYRLERDDYMIMAAETFKDDYRATFFRGTREFDIEYGRIYHLLDADMETLGVGI